MSEQVNPKDLPHEFLLRKHSLSISDMSAHTKQLKKDLDRTLQLVLNKSKDGEVKLTPATQQKISTYDRYICDGIFEYLEDKDRISDNMAVEEEKNMDNKREEFKEVMEEAHEEAINKQTDEPTPTPTNEPQTETPTPSAEEPKEEPKSGVGIGFFGNWS